MSAQTKSGRKPASERAPRQSRKKAAQKPIDQLRSAVAEASAHIPLMIGVHIAYVAPGVYAARWGSGEYKGTHGHVALWVCACVAAGKLLPALTNDAIQRIGAAMRSLGAVAHAG